MNITRAADASIHAVSPALSFGTGHLQGKKPQRCEHRNLRPVQGRVKQPVGRSERGAETSTLGLRTSPQLFATSAWPLFAASASTDPRREERSGREQFPRAVWSAGQETVSPHCCSW